MTSMSEPTKNIEVEVFLAVSDYIGKIQPDASGVIPGSDLAFQRAANDVEGAEVAAKEYLFYELPVSEAESVKVVSASYLETDSSNPTHACACYSVTLEVPVSLAEKVEAVFMGDGDTSPTP